MGNIKRKPRVSDFRYDIGECYGDCLIVDRYRNKDRIKAYVCKCKKCNTISHKTENNLKYALEKKNMSCNVCNGHEVKVGYNDIPTTHPWMVKYFEGGEEEAKKYTYGSSKKVTVKCPLCGRVKDKKMEIREIYKHKSIGCPCGDGKSYPEKFMFSCLEQLGIKFITEYSPEWIKPMRYDFYLPDKKLIIETDGGLGHGKNSWGKCEKEKYIKRDRVKDKKAEENGLKIIRIDCSKSKLNYIKNEIIKSKLFTDTELKEISFEKAEEFALCNLVKLVCDEYMKLKPILPKDLGRALHLSTQMTRDYLKKGVEIGWCDYDPLENKRSNVRENCPPKRRKIIVYKDYIFVGCYDSIAEFCRCSEIVVGEKINATGVRYALENNSIHKGHYTFTDIKEDGTMSMQYERIGSEEE